MIEIVSTTAARLLLPLWEKVAAREASGRMRGKAPTSEVCVSPLTRVESGGAGSDLHPSPTRGEGASGPAFAKESRGACRTNLSRGALNNDREY
jgi:hypothetical protein